MQAEKEIYIFNLTECTLKYKLKGDYGINFGITRIASNKEHLMSSFTASISMPPLTKAFPFGICNNLIQILYSSKNKSFHILREQNYSCHELKLYSFSVFLLRFIQFLLYPIPSHTCTYVLLTLKEFQHFNL